LTRFEARVQLVFGNHVVPWTRHIQSGHTLVRRAFDTAQATGDLTFAAYASVLSVANLLAMGAPLAEVQEEAENGIAFARNARFDAVADNLVAQLGLIRALRGETPDFASSNDAGHHRGWFEQQLRDDWSLNSWWYWVRKLQASVYAGDYASAVEAATKARGLSWSTSSFVEVAEYHFHDALARAASCDSAQADDRRRHIEAIVAHHDQLARWAASCPENFSDRAALIAAEIARLEGRE